MTTIAVCESGLKTAGDLARCSAMGYRAFLIGERFIDRSRRSWARRRLAARSRRSARGRGRHARLMLVKICGITRVEDARAAVGRAPARSVSSSGRKARGSSIRFGPREIAAALPPFVTAVGVFVNQDRDTSDAVAALVKLGAVQLHGDESRTMRRPSSRPVIKAIAVSGRGRRRGEWPECGDPAARYPRSVHGAVEPAGRSTGRPPPRSLRGDARPGRRPDARQRRRGDRNGAAIRNRRVVGGRAIPRHQGSRAHRALYASAIARRDD